MKTKTLTIIAMAALLIGCHDRSPIGLPEPRTRQEYAEDEKVCIRKHTFSVTDQASGECLHCELFLLCMEGHLWTMGKKMPPEVTVPCCRGTRPGS